MVGRLQLKWVIYLHVVAAPCKRSNDKPRQRIKKQRYHFAYKSPFSWIYGYCSSQIHIWELDNKKKLSTKEFVPSNCGAGKDSWESPGLQRDQTSQS